MLSSHSEDAGRIVQRLSICLPGRGMCLVRETKERCANLVWSSRGGGGGEGEGETHPDTQLRRVKRWGSPCGLSTIAFLETWLKAGMVQSLAPTQGIPPPPPPDNLPTAHSGLHSLVGITSAISPSHLMGGH